MKKFEVKGGRHLLTSVLNNSKCHPKTFPEAEVLLNSQMQGVSGF